MFKLSDPVLVAALAAQGVEATADRLVLEATFRASEFRERLSMEQVQFTAAFQTSGGRKARH